MGATGTFETWALCCLCLVISGHGAKILLLPVPMYSHCLEMSTVGHELVSRGHQASIVVGSSFRHKNCHKQAFDGGTGNISEIMYQDDPSSSSLEEVTKQVSSKLLSGEGISLMNNIDVIQNVSRGFCANILLNKKLFQILFESNFDLIIVDGIFPLYCYYVLPYKLGVPYVSTSTFFEDFVSGRPFLPGVFPAGHTEHADDMSFFQKLRNALNHVTLHVLARYIMPMDLISRVAPELSRRDIISLAAKSELFLFNIDTVLGYPYPKMPNHVFIGGVACRPPKSLTAQFARFFENATRPVILVTFGSTFGSLPEKIEAKFLSALKRLRAEVVWKYTISSNDSNIHYEEWVPQNDILGTPNTKLFISHCGNNGLFEALYHGVPILCTPLFGDQFYNSQRVRRWNVGKVLNLLAATEDEIYTDIFEILENPVYSENMKRASVMYHSQPQSPRQRAAVWIEHILDFGAEHLRSRATELSTFSYMGYDILCFVLLLAALSTFSVYFCCHTTWRRQLSYRT